MHFLDESFWLAISFILFLYLLYRPIKKVILNSLDAKILEVQEKVLKAEKLKDDAVLLFEQTRKQLEILEVLRNQMLQEGQKHTEEIVKEKNKEIEEFLERKKIEVVKLIENQKNQASQTLQIEFCDQVIELVLAYFQSSKSTDFLDSDIAKNLMNNQIKNPDNKYN
ncbi:MULTISPECIES: ATP F0F1 synthase subunit B [unclassified Rickettsia]|uniref:F0F1 ATP synthase subunit B family protein n=1 Tax=unclassified Rickettsia TaxID=114295 RepID=UPI00209EF68B|nr:ATP F0F1 synthase subunit B [Rickettsia endosymbiont of Ceutorhynchus assimilis]